MNKLLPLGAIAALAALSVPAVAKDPPKRSPLVDALGACRAIADPAERVACYDRQAGALLDATSKGDVAVVDKSEVRKARKSLFGFAMPKIPFFSGDDTTDVVSDTLESTVKSANGIGYGKFRMTIAEGNGM
mgnify:CR=1 FL=1